MTTIADRFGLLSATSKVHDAPAPRRNVTLHPPLMGDIVSARAEIPELLIRWRRARGEDDPRPPATMTGQ